MTTSRTASSASSSPPLERFANSLAHGMPSHSRRDFVRHAAVISAAAAMPMALGVRGSVAQSSTGHTQAQGDIETDVELNLPLNPFGQAIMLDPHRAPNWGPFWVLLPHVWAGLLAFDENGAVVLDLAESFEPNETADVWTAKLLPDLTFASGNPITAQSFVDSWKRALDPNRLAPMSTFMELVDGYEDYVTGASADIGFTIIDDLTIEIALSEPFSSFPASLATFGWAVVDLTVIEDPGNEGPLLSGAGAGIWQFTELVDGDRLAMEPNPSSVHPASPSISRVVWRILEGPEAEAAALELYRSDDVASADVPASLMADVTGDDVLSSELIAVESHASTMAIGMDFNQEPFGDSRIRQAIAASIDRDRWASEIWAGEFVPAVGIVPPVVSVTSGYEHATPIAFDPDRAKSLLDEAGVDLANNAPDIVYYQPATDSADNIEKQAALLAMIEESSGIPIRHDTTLTVDQIAALQGDNGGRQFDIVWWWTVTDTASLLQTVGKSTSPYMAGWFNWAAALESTNPEAAEASTAFDELIADANSATDPNGRNAAFQQAEQLVLDQAVYIPLGHWVQRFVQKPWLVGTRQGPWSGRIPVRFDESVVIQGRSTE